MDRKRKEGKKVVLSGLTIGATRTDQMHKRKSAAAGASKPELYNIEKKEKIM